MSITNTQLYQIVASELGIINGDETLGTTDSSVISTTATSVRAWLIEDGTCYWADDAIPDAAYIALAKVIAGQCKIPFGRADYQEGPVGYELLRQHVSKRSARQPVQMENF